MADVDDIKELPTPVDPQQKERLKIDLTNSDQISVNPDQSVVPTAREVATPIDFGRLEPITEEEVARTRGVPSVPQYLQYKFRKGFAPMIRGAYGASAMRGETSPEDALSQGNAEYLDQLDKAGMMQDIHFTQNPLLFMFGEAAEILPLMIEGIAQGTKEALIVGGGFAATALAAGQAGPQVLTPEEVYTVPGAFLAGASTGFAFGIAKNSMNVEGGNIYLDLIEAKVDPNVATNTAAVAGALIGMIEVFQIDLLAAPFKKAFAKKMSSDTGKKIINNWATRYLKTVGLEVIEEDLQSVVDLMAKTIAGRIDDNPDVIPTAEEWREELVQTTVKTLAALAVISAPGAAVDIATGAKVKKEERAITEEEAKKEGVTIKELKKLVTDEKLQETTEKVEKLLKQDKLTPKQQAELVSLADEATELIKTQEVEVVPIKEKKISVAGKIIDLDARTKQIQKALEEARKVRKIRSLTKQEVKKVQTSVIEVLEQSDLPAKDKAKFLRAVKNIQTPQQLQKALPSIESRIQRLEDASITRLATDEITKLIKKAKPKKVGKTRVGKFDVETQKVFSELNTTIRFKQSEAVATMPSMLEAVQQNPNDIGLIMNARLTSLKAGSYSLEGTLQLLEDLSVLATEGKSKLAEKVQKQKEIQTANRQSAIDTITGGEGLPAGFETTGIKDFTIAQGKGKKFATLTKDMAWADMLDILSSLDPSAQGESFLETWGDVNGQLDKTSKGERISTKQIRELSAKAYGITDPAKLYNKFTDDQVESEIGFFINANGDEVVLSMSKAQLRKRFMELQDPTLEKTFREGMAYTDEMVVAIEEQLSDEDKAFAFAQLDFYRDYYDKVNKVYREMFNIDLPFNEWYSPIRREGIDTTGLNAVNSFLKETQFRASGRPASLKTRLPNTHRIAESSDINVLMRHVMDMEHFMGWATKVRDLKGVFGDPIVKKAVKGTYGPSTLSVIDNFIEAFATGRISSKLLLNEVEKWRTNFIPARTGVRPAQYAKQLTSIFAYLEQTPVASFTKNLAAFWADPIGNAKALTSTEFLRSRGLDFTRDLKIIQESDEFRAFRVKPSFKNSLMLFTRLGDRHAIIWGGWAHYKHVLDTTGSKQKARESFVKLSRKTQQSGDISELSVHQRMGTLGRLLSMFMNTKMQYLRREMKAIRGLVSGRANKAQALKALAIYHVVLPTLWQFVSNGFRWDDKEQARAAILGSFNGVFLFGDAMQVLLGHMTGADNFPKEIFLLDIADDMGKVAKIFKDDDISLEDVDRAIKGLLGAIGGISGYNIKAGFSMSQGVVDAFDGEYGSGLKQALGWNPKKFNDEADSERNRAVGR